MHTDFTHVANSCSWIPLLRGTISDSFYMKIPLSAACLDSADNPIYNFVQVGPNTLLTLPDQAIVYH